MFDVLLVTKCTPYPKRPKLIKREKLSINYSIQVHMQLKVTPGNRTQIHLGF